MIDIEYTNAYTEVLEILKYISLEDYQKLPKDLINLFREQCNKQYHFKFDIKKEINEQKISYITKIILAILFRDYWATDRQREIIMNKEKLDRELIENKKRENYSPNMLFENKK